MRSPRLLLSIPIVALMATGCAIAGEAPSAPPAAAVAPGRPAVVVISEEGKAARRGASASDAMRREDPTATPDDFFQRFASTVSTQTALMPTALAASPSPSAGGANRVPHTPV